MSGFLEIVDTTYIPGTGPLPAGPGQCDVGECAPSTCRSYLLTLKKTMVPPPADFIPRPITPVPCEEKIIQVDATIIMRHTGAGGLMSGTYASQASFEMEDKYGFGYMVNEDGTPNAWGKFYKIRNPNCYTKPKPPTTPTTTVTKCYTRKNCSGPTGSACTDEEICIDVPVSDPIGTPSVEIVYKELPSPQVQVCGLCPAPKVVTDYISSRYSTSTTIEDVITDLKDELTALLTEQGTLYVSLRPCGPIPITQPPFFPPASEPPAQIKPIDSTFNFICGTVVPILPPNAFSFELRHSMPLLSTIQTVDGSTDIDTLRLLNYIESTNVWLKNNWDTMDPSLKNAYLLAMVRSPIGDGLIPRLYKVSSDTRELVVTDISSIDRDTNYTWIGMIPLETSASNLLIEFNPITAQLEESIVSSNPYTNNGPRPEKYFVSYLPGVSTFLSSLSPVYFLELKNTIEQTFSNITNRPCCYSYKDYFGRQTNSCNYITPSLCTIDGVTAFLASSSQASQSPLTVISAIPLADGTSCEDAACAGSFPQEIQGTCCIPGSSGWSCSVTTQSACYDAKGFWEAPKPDGLGGFNEANCTDRGVEHTNVDGTLKTVAYGPRNCAIHGDSVVDDTVTDKGACCSFQLASIVDNDLSVGATLHNNIIRKLYSAVDDPNYPVNGVYPIDVRFSMTNDGTSITLCFPYSSIIDKLYPLPDNYDPLRLEEAAAIMAQRNQRIVADFSVVPTSPTVSSWSVNVDRIEGNCIFLSIIKVS